MDKLIEEGVIVDAIIADLPYNTTMAKWDIAIPLNALWERYKKLIKKDGVIILFGSQPFTSKLIVSNFKWFKEELIWKKHKASNFAQAKNRHLKYHENIIVFSNGKYTYNRQMQPRTDKRVESGIKNNNITYNTNSKENTNEICLKSNLGKRSYSVYDAKFKNPMSVLEFPMVAGNSKEKLPHPCQKPLLLMDYLVKTYTNEGDLILDNTMGVGSTIVSALNNNRKAIGIELDKNYFNIAKDRIEKVVVGV